MKGLGDFEVSPEMWSKPDKQGELRKQGHVVKNWKTRWFVIQHDMMFYFKGRGDAKPVGCIPLRSCQIKEATKINRANCFELSAPRINKVFFIQCSGAQEVKEWMEAVEAGSEYSSVSAPYNVQHEIHVDFDSATGFSGLPPEWEALLKGSGISREEVIANPDETLQVLEFQSNFIKDEKQQSKLGVASFMTPKATPLPEEKPITLSELVDKDIPTTRYNDLIKIGEGAAGEVFVANDAKSSGKKVAVKKNGN